METKVIHIETKQEFILDTPKDGENKMVCPICSHTRKKKKDKCFSYNTIKNMGRCNHCSESLVEKREFQKEEQQIEYKRPLFPSISSYSEGFKKFFTDRKISEETLVAMKVTEGVEYMPQASKEINTIQFNYFKNGQIVNVKYRGANKSFKLFKDGELIMYNIDVAINNKEIIIVEGEMDCLAMIEAGYKNTISVPNGASLGNINLSYLDNCVEMFDNDTQFILALDNDEAGSNLRDELARRLGFENCNKVIFKDCKDANDCLVKYGVQGIIDSMSNKSEFPIEGVFNANDIKDDIYSYYKDGLPKGSNIGLDELDDLIKFQEGYITTISGIPGHGKSEFLDFILCKLNILHGWKTALYSPENHPLELHFSKFAEKMIGKPFEGNNRLSSIELDGMIKYHSKNFFFINPEEDFTIDNILVAVKSLIRKKGVKAFVIDAWNKLDHHYTTNETKYISEQLDKLVMFCEKNKVHLFLVAHPTKIQKDKSTGLHEVPTLYNISGSANFYNKTSNGLVVYRNYAEGTTEIYVQKVKFKHWGKVGNVHLAWDYKNGRYYKGNPDDTNWLSSINNKPNQSSIVENTDFLNEQPIIDVNSTIEPNRDSIDDPDSPPF